jgi:class 3 adenylate cyclase
MELPKIGKIDAFAIIVDINAFTPMVSKSAYCNDSISQFVRDILSGGIEILEKHGGNVVSFMGDAFLAVIDNVDSLYMACVGIAKDLDRICEYISNHQSNFPDAWSFARGGPSLKIGVEYGWMDLSTISSKLLGEQKILIGPPINYATRIAASGEGNRCNVGPLAMDRGMNQWRNSGPYTKMGKLVEGEYIYWEMELGDIWIKRTLGEYDDTYWG